MAKVLYSALAASIVILNGCGQAAKAPSNLEDILADLQALEVKLKTGTEYQDFAADFAEISPKIQRFLNSKESENDIELCFFLTNINDCYSIVKDKWRDSVEGEGVEKQNAKEWLSIGQPILYSCADKNVDGMKILVEGNANQVKSLKVTLLNDNSDYSLLNACYMMVMSAGGHNDSFANNVGFVPEDFEFLRIRFEKAAKVSERASQIWLELQRCLRHNVEQIRRLAEEKATEEKFRRERAEQERLDAEARRKMETEQKQLEEHQKRVALEEKSRMEKEQKRAELEDKRRAEQEQKRLEKQERMEYERNQASLGNPQGPAPLRVWSSIDGNFKVTARLIKQESSAVNLEKKDGSQIRTTKDKLCESDQEWLRQYKKFIADHESKRQKGSARGPRR
jgi:hypothetical protein